MINRTAYPYGYVYLIRHKLNNLLYVGATTDDIQKRWKGHIAASITNMYDSPIANAIKKCGVEYFEISKIKTCFSPEHLKDSETYFINFYQSYLPENGYNRGRVGTLIPKERAAKRNLIPKTLRFEESVFEWVKKNDLKMQSLVTRLMDKYKAEKETEQQKISNYQK